MKKTVRRVCWAVGLAAGLAAAIGCGEEDSDPGADLLECELRSAEAQSGAQTSTMVVERADPPEGEEPGERVDTTDRPGTEQEAQRLAVALCNDPPSGQERVELQSDGIRRCAFGLRPDVPDDFTTSRCEAMADAR
jgi:hypothetical protein